jgi:hypothetical protein
MPANLDDDQAVEKYKKGRTNWRTARNWTGKKNNSTG